MHKTVIWVKILRFYYVFKMVCGIYGLTAHFPHFFSIFRDSGKFKGVYFMFYI